MTQEEFEYILEKIDQMRDEICQQFKTLSEEEYYHQHLSTPDELPWKAIYRDAENKEEVLEQILHTLKENYLGGYYACYMQKTLIKLPTEGNPIVAEINDMAKMINDITAKRGLVLPPSPPLQQDADASKLGEKLAFLFLRLITKLS